MCSISVLLSLCRDPVVDVPVECPIEILFVVASADPSHEALPQTSVVDVGPKLVDNVIPDRLGRIDIREVDDRDESRVIFTRIAGGLGGGRRSRRHS
jgi:hypothetical protein